MLSPIDIKYFKQAVPGPYNESQVDIAAKCPICGDSRRRANLRRLHLYERSGLTLVHCFNGDCHLNTQMKLSSFLKFFKPELHFNYKKENFTNVFLPIESQEQKINFDFNISELKDTENSNIEDYRTNTILQNISNDPNHTEIIRKYLIHRGFNEESLKLINYYIGMNDFQLDGKFFNIKGFLIIPFFNQDKLYGFYGRSLTEKKFINFSLISGLNIWNLYNINPNKPTLLFESILDAVSFRQIYNFSNVVSLNTNYISKNALEIIKNPVFCLDNDNPGISKMAEFAKNSNFKFLIYPENLEYKDFNEMLMNNVKIDLRFESGFKALIELKKLL